MLQASPTELRGKEKNQQLWKRRHTVDLGRLCRNLGLCKLVLDVAQEQTTPTGIKFNMPTPPQNVSNRRMALDWHLRCVFTEKSVLSTGVHVYPQEERL